MYNFYSVHESIESVEYKRRGEVPQLGLFLALEQVLNSVLIFEVQFPPEFEVVHTFLDFHYPFLWLGVEYFVGVQEIATLKKEVKKDL